MDKRTAKRMAKQLEEKAVLDVERQSVRLKEDPTLILYDNGRLFDEKTNKFCRTTKTREKISIYTGLIPNLQRRERLTAVNFVSNDDPVNKTCILHKNSDKLDDRFDNLEWITYEQERNIICADFLKEFSKNNPDVEFKEYHLNPLYIIFNNGFIFTKNQCKIMKFVSDEHGYQTICLAINNKKSTLYIHRIIAETFVKNNDPNNYTVVDHIDRDPSNNDYKNLRWVNYSINNSNKDPEAFGKKKINQFDIKGNFIASYNSITEAQILTKTSKEISRCLRGDIPYVISRKDGEATKFIWRYDDPNNLIRHGIPENAVQIKEYPSYWITPDNKIYSELSKKYIKTHIIGGYYTVDLRNKGSKKRKFYLHRLVAEHFIINKPENYQNLFINHIDGCRLNNNVENLEYVTIRENNIHSIEVLNNGRKKIICYDTYTEEILKFKSVKAIAEYFDVSIQSMSQTIKKQSKELYKKRYKLSYDDE